MKKPSSGTSQQLPFDLPVEPSASRDDLIESPANSTAIAMVDAWPNWPGSLAVLAGPVGSGKSHISSIWIEEAGGKSCPLENLPERIDELQVCVENGGNLLLEDAIPGKLDETALFHILNFIRQFNQFCLITSRTWPLEWNVQLPDLASRLRAAQVVELHEPDDLLLKQVMVKLFADRQLMVDEKIIDYCALRMERSLETAAKLVAEVDAEAMARKSPISRTIVAQVLEQMGMG
ncbi:MAG: hypothetical protein AAF478_03375 [Pseudomonadota bacterium]